VVPVRPDDGGSARERLRGALGRALYSGWYIVGSPTPPTGDSVAASRIIGREHVAQLEAARTNTRTLREGLPLYEINGDTATFGVLGLRMTAPLSELVTDGPRVPGATVGVWMPNERRASAPGFWLMFGRVHPPDLDDSRIVRVYWNLCADGAPKLVRALGAGLDDAGVGYRLKLLSAPHHYRKRTDTAVLYLERNDWEAGAEAIARAQHAVAQWLDPETPVFTRRIAPGLATADDPGGAVSFGQHRCGLVADGLIRVWEEGRTTIRDRVAAIEAAFEAASIDLARPHLQPGSTDLPELPIAPRRAARPNRPPSLEVARTICRQIADQAQWHEDRCGWLAPMILPHPEGGFEQGWGSLSPDLYDGSAGVALALAEVASACGDDLLARTALAAIRAAVRRAHETPPLGLFEGRAGIQIASARVARLLGGTPIEMVDETPEPEARFDLLGGTAGAIVADLALERKPETAIKNGEALLAVATRETNPCGLSRGSAGIGLALAELAGRTGRAAFRRGALDAFANERIHFDRTFQNWSSTPQRDGPDDIPPSFRATWCEGAGGIALSRLRAWELLGDDVLRDEAFTALRTTERVTRAWLRSGCWNFTLCHGLAGNAEILRLGAEIHPAGLALADEVMRAGAQRITARGRQWPCGVPDGEPPSLMNGLAGIAHAYLRLHDPTVPSVLLPRAGSFAPASAGPG
jgi:hypothetical protein